MRMRDWSSDVCSSDLCRRSVAPLFRGAGTGGADARCAGRGNRAYAGGFRAGDGRAAAVRAVVADVPAGGGARPGRGVRGPGGPGRGAGLHGDRSEEHTSELQSLMRISYAVFCLKKHNINLTTSRYSRIYNTQTN